MSSVDNKGYLFLIVNLRAYLLKFPLPFKQMIILDDLIPSTYHQKYFTMFLTGKRKLHVNLQTRTFSKSLSCRKYKEQIKVSIIII